LSTADSIHVGGEQPRTICDDVRAQTALFIGADGVSKAAHVTLGGHKHRCLEIQPNSISHLPELFFPVVETTLPGIIINL
jgi:hypothetical protein